MRRAFVHAVLLTLCACARPGEQPPVNGTTRPLDAQLRADLLAREAQDQTVRAEFAAAARGGHAPDSALLARLTDVDTANTRWLDAVMARRGWPGRTAVGVDAANAAFLLVQHADRDTAFQAWALPLLERAYAMGEATGQQLALLSDRLATARGQAQMYGTQADVTGGRVVLKPIADSAGVDARRAAVGLPPLGVYVRMLDSIYSNRSAP